VKPQPGHFYAVGVGPGAPDLLTLRAVNIIEGCDAIIAPRSKNSESSLALSIVQKYLHDQETLELTYSMIRNQKCTQDTWIKGSDWVMARILAKKSVVQLTLGDPLIYSTSSYLLAALHERLDQEYIHIVPGISAAQAAAAVFGEVLSSQEDRISILSANDFKALERALDHSETVAIYKVASRLEELIDLLEQKKLLGQAKLAFAVEQNHQKLITDLRLARGTNLGYMSIVLVRKKRRDWYEF
jgi:precorrin-2/cobalt-factor-2 C20-methyltransferase